MPVAGRVLLWWTMHYPSPGTHHLPLWLRVLLTSGIFVLLAAAPAAPRTPGWPRSEVGRFEIPALDFRPEGAWRLRAESIRLRRNTLLRAGALRTLNAPGPSLRVQGAFHVPVVPIAFANVAPPFAPSGYADVLFADVAPGAPASVRSYYAEQSRGAVQIDGTVFAWVVADSADTYYEDGCNGVGVQNLCPHGGRRFGELLIEGLTRSDTGAVDWGQYDNDGADGLPNSGDDDGVVDFVTFLQPEVDGACGTSHIWAHRYDLRVWNGGSPYVTHSPVRDAGGAPVPGRFIQVSDYTMQSGVGGVSACGSASEIMTIGTVAHETGHAFGLPDLYDTNLQSSGVTQGIGEWGIMGSGNYSQPYSPSSHDAWSLTEMGWVVVDTLRTGGTITLAPIQTGDTVLYLGVPQTDEYFLLENRQSIGTDTAQFNPACQFRTRVCAKAPGLLIWHIDQGQVTLHGFRRDNRVNSGPVHGVALVQADGRNDLGRPGTTNRGDTGDAWPGATGNTTLAPTSAPPALDNQGADAGFVLDSLRPSGPSGALAFRYRPTPAGQPVLTLTWATDQILGIGQLGSAQLALLDSLGNRSGGYDVGDFLAYYRTALISGAGRSAR